MIGSLELAVALDGFLNVESQTVFATTGYLLEKGHVEQQSKGSGRYTTENHRIGIDDLLRASCRSSSSLNRTKGLGD